MRIRNSMLFAIVVLSSVIITACGNQNEKQASDAVSEQNDHPSHDKRKGPPPHGEHREGRPPHGERGEGRPPKGERKLPEQTKTLEEIGGYKIGETASDFELKNVDGSTYSLADIDNAKGYIVVFTCNECPFAKMYEDRLIKLHNNYASKGYSVVAINANSSTDNEDEHFDAMQKRADEKDFPFVYLEDDAKIFAKYGAVRTPHVFLLDKEKTVQYIGAIDNNAKSSEDVTEKYVENAIKALENGEKPTPNLTKAIGCPIKAS